MKAERMLPEEQRSSSWGMVLAFIVGVTIIGVGGYFGYQQILHTEALHEQQFKKLDISLKNLDANQAARLAPIVRGYIGDYCDPRLKKLLLRQVSDAGFVQLSAQLAVDHYGRCAKDSYFLEWASSSYQKLGDYSKALDVRNSLVSIDPASADHRFWRGKIYEEIGRFDKALIDYISAVDLLGRPEKIAASQFYEIATMYARLGRYCEAATPLETFVAFDYARRMTPQIQRLINEYRVKGNCALSTRSESTISRIRPGSVLLVRASVNGMAGVFVLDTGASLVTVTRSFAMRSRVNMDSESEIVLQTANGLAKGILSTARSVQVGDAFSTFVPVVVVDDKQLSTDADVVGLLGMSFLSRFHLTINRDSIELRSR